MKAKKLIALLLTLALALSLLAGCGSKPAETPKDTGANTPDAQPQDTGALDLGDFSVGGEAATEEVAPEDRYPKVTLAINADWGNMQPYNIHTGTRGYILQNIYEFLFEYSPSEEGWDMYQPMLAKGFEKVEGVEGATGDVYDVFLYDYIKDTEGNHITADDVIFCYDFSVNGGYTNKFDMVEKYEKVDDYTIRFFFNKEIDSLGELEWVWGRYPICDESMFEQCSTNPVGTGAYKCKEFVTGSHIIFEANDNYWQKPELTSKYHWRNVQEIEYRVISESSSQVVELQTGTIDYSEAVPSENLADFQEGGKYDQGYQVYQMPQDYSYMVIPSHDENSVCKDPNMRLAIYYAINNKAVELALGGTVIASTTYGSYKLPDTYPSLQEKESFVTAYDLAKSKEYLDKTDYDGETLIISYDATKLFPKVAEVIQNMLAQAGIKTELMPNDNAQSQAITPDYTKWDIRINGCGGSFLVTSLNKFLNPNEFGLGVQLGGYYDETLYKLFRTAWSMDGHNEENMNALIDHLLKEENAYFCPVCFTCASIVYSDAFASLHYREGTYLMAGACSYNVG